MSTNGTHRFDGPLVDRAQMGRLFRAARIVAGYDRVEDAAAAVQDLSGTHISARTLYALERGEQALTLEHFIGVLLTFRPPGNAGFFLSGFRQDVQRIYEESLRGHH